MINSPYAGIETANWFRRFVARCNELDALPIALDVYYDDWKVSNQDSIGGLYFSIANTPRHLLWRTMHKHLISLIPYSIDIQDVIVELLGDVKDGNDVMEIMVEEENQRFLVICAEGNR